MNNPEANFMSPLRTQPIKKQRGGSTPTSIGKSGSGNSNNSRPAAAFNGGSATTATTTSTTTSRPPTATNVTSSNSNGNTGPPRDLQASADDAIARRRAELRRLTGQRNANANATKAVAPPSSSNGSSTDDWMAQARSTLGGGGGGGGGGGSKAAPPTMPPVVPVKSTLSRARASDIFPTVDKSSLPPRSSSSSSQPPIMVGASVSASASGSALRPALEERTTSTTTATATSAPPTQTAPPKPTQTTIAPPSPSSLKSNPNSNSRAVSMGRTTQAPPRPPPASPSAKAPQVVPPSAKVARRLDASFAAREARAKSAPPARPPPPQGGPPPKKAVAMAATATAKSKSNTGPPPPSSSSSSSSSKPSRTQISSRPTPMSAASLLSPAPVTKPTTAETTTTTPALKKTRDAVKTPAPTAFLKHQKEAIQTPALKPTATTSNSDESIQTPASDTFLKQASDAVQTPTAAAVANGAPPSTDRRDKIRNLRASADTPPSLKRVTQEIEIEIEMETKTALPKVVPVLISETTTRLEQDLKKTMKDKNMALELIANLEQQLSDAQSMHLQAQLDVATPDPSSNSQIQSQLLSEFLHLRSTSGEDQALQWAQQHLNGHENNGHGNETQVGFMAPMNGAIPTTPMAANGTPRRKVRVGTPHPKRSFGQDQNDNNDNMEDSNPDAALSLKEMERKYHDYFIEAAHNIPYEYSTELATFTVRRPYGLATHTELFSECSLVDLDQYSRRAHISSVASLELAVTIHADGTVLLLHSDAGVRYKTLNHGVWKEHVNVDELDRPLGNISYIDTHANEKDYSLDEVLEEALLTRELYGSSMMNAALAFKDRQPNIDKALQRAAEEAAAAMQAKAPPETAIPKQVTEMCVGTEDLPFPPKTIEVPVPDGKEEKKKKDPAAAVVKKAPASEESSGGGGSDLFTTLIGGFFGLVWSFFWSLLVKTPLNVVRMTMTMIFAYAMVSLVLLYAAEEQATVGSNPYYYYNRPGVY